MDVFPSFSIEGTGKSGLGEPFGKASLADTADKLGRFISKGDGSCWPGEGWSCYPSEAWPDEALERGLPRSLAERGKNWGWANIIYVLTYKKNRQKIVMRWKFGMFF
jgi:hypothetical protein